MKTQQILKSLTAVAVVAISFMACSKVSVQPAQSEEDLVVKKSQKSMDFIVNEDIDLCQNYPPTGFYGENILSDEVTTVKRGQNYSMRVNVRQFAVDDCIDSDIGLVKISIIVPEADFYYLYDKEAEGMNWSLSYYYKIEDRNNPTFFACGAHSDILVQVLTKEDYITIEYFERRDGAIDPTEPTKTKRLRVID